MATDRPVPKPGDRVRYTIEFTVGAYVAHRILGGRSDDGHRWSLPYDSHAMYPENGVTLEVVTQPAHAEQVPA